MCDLDLPPRRSARLLWFEPSSQLRRPPSGTRVPSRALVNQKPNRIPPWRTAQGSSAAPRPAVVPGIWPCLLAAAYQNSAATVPVAARPGRPPFVTPIRKTTAEQDTSLPLKLSLFSLSSCAIDVHG